MAERTSPTGRNLPAFHCQLLIALVLLCSVMGCRGNHNAAAEQEEAVDLQQIKDNGELVVLTLYSSTSYFIYRGQNMGFQYELGEQFAKSLGVKLKIKVAKNIHDLIERLLAGEGDLIAYNLPITKEWKDSLIYCGEGDYPSGHRTTYRRPRQTVERCNGTYRKGCVRKTRKVL